MWHLSLTKFGVFTDMPGTNAAEAHFFVDLYIGGFYFCSYFAYSLMK
jgi:hypothetical protein